MLVIAHAGHWLVQLIYLVDPATKKKVGWNPV